MNLIKKLRNKTNYLYARYVKREPFLLEVSRWFSDDGDNTMRLDYPLTKDSVVFDVGGYHGDFAEVINQKYHCKVYVFEPVKEFYELCVKRFKNNSKVVCLNYGLSSKDECLDIGLAENASSFDSPHTEGNTQGVELRSVEGCVSDLNVEHIDLFKINIEGGEFEVIPALIHSGLIKSIQYLQVQFHDFVDHAEEKRKLIRNELMKTHTEMWNYEFVWESWKVK